MTPQCHRLLGVLLAAQGRYVSLRGLIDALYGHRLDGGPRTAETVVRVIIHRLRRGGLVPEGHVVEARHGYGYRLVERNPA